jgi:hypothetical protein
MKNVIGNIAYGFPVFHLLQNQECLIFDGAYLQHQI